MIKPFDPLELRTRVRVGSRILGLQQKLVDRAREMEVMGARIAEQERFSRAVSEMSDAIVTLDEHWRLTTANRAACRLLNLDPDEWAASATKHDDSWWGHWVDWMLARSEGSRPAPAAPGNDTFTAIVPAPGRYVLGE